IKSHSLNITSKKYYNDFENIREIYGRHFLNRSNKKYSLLNQFQSDKILVSKMDSLENSSPLQTEELVNETNIFYDTIKKMRLRGWLLEDKQHLKGALFNILILIAGFPLFLFGFIFNAVPFFLTDKIVRKKVKDESFWSTFFLGAGIILFPLFYMIEFFALSWLISGLWIKLAFLIAMPFAGKLAFKWYIVYRKTSGRLRLLWLKYFSPGQYNHIIKLKDSLFKKLDPLI
ncbi:MAG: hypothetical protein PHG29_12150, partial [Prolixibacteraceae bacterium]|nr:hypothetical protein [Prolixibacteraceae bacterium]